MRGIQSRLPVYTLLFLFLATLPSGSAALDPPTTYHLSFDSTAFIAEDDIHSKFKGPTLQDRNLSIVDGVFGKAFLNGNTFSPEEKEKTAMSTWDLDSMLEVLCLNRFDYWKLFPKSGHMEPYIWGTGRLTTDGGSVAFWAKGTRTEPGILFFQTASSFGRHEKYLFAVELNADRTLGAYIRDARYAYHRIKSATVWDDGRFNHVALVWDRAQGLRLFLNGEEIASNWGRDAWWTTQTPGLFHLPMGGFASDELWIFDRPLDTPEIRRLMKENKPPVDSRRPIPLDRAAADRLRAAFLGNSADRLPAVGPSSGKSYLRFRELFPEEAGDGCVPAHAVMDGKYELAWPVDYNTFTNILGDSDFHPEKVDVLLPAGNVVNYITLEGNLTGARVLAGDSSGALKEVLAVPQGGQHFFGAQVEPVAARRFRVPFLTGYGSPPGYAPGLNLSLTGDIRIHELGFFAVSADSSNAAPETVQRRFSIGADEAIPTDGRYGYAMRAFNDRRNGGVAALTPDVSGKSRRITPGPFARLNLLSPGWPAAETVTEVELSLAVKNVAANDFAVVRLHDPGVPARIWTSVAFRLAEFPKTGGTLRVRLDCTDIKMAQGDRLWLDVLFSGGVEILAGGDTSTVTVSTVPLALAGADYGRKELQPALTDYSRIYPWYYPWTNMKIVPDLERPVTFGGFFDVVQYPLAVKRTEPDNHLATMLQTLTLIPFSDKQGVISVDAWEATPNQWKPAVPGPQDGSPEWAHFMRHYLKGYHAIVEWWADHQNPDGQVGGGWKDDALFASRLPGVFLYLGDERARGIFDKLYYGIEKTKMFEDGYCRYAPNDYIHVDDLTRNRYERLLYRLGDPDQMLAAMRTAWHFEKPDKTPVNYIDGNSFKFDRDLLLWYWGETPAYPPYADTRAQVTAKMKEIAPSMNDVAFFRYTSANIYTDYSYMPGTNDIKRTAIGGQPGPLVAGLNLAVVWDEGSDPDITRWVESATDTSLVVHFYSYARAGRVISGRLFRLKDGEYRITLAFEGNDAAGGTTLERVNRLGRFSEVSFPVRPNREIVLRIVRTRPLPAPGPLPDLALASIAREGNTLRAVVYNFGAADSPASTIALLDAAGRKVAEQPVPPIANAHDFVPKKATIMIAMPAGAEGLRAVMNPDAAFREIVRTNNELPVTP